MLCSWPGLQHSLPCGGKRVEPEGADTLTPGKTSLPPGCRPPGRCTNLKCLRHDIWACCFAGTVKVKSSNIQVGDLIIVEKVRGAWGPGQRGQVLPPLPRARRSVGPIHLWSTAVSDSDFVPANDFMGNRDERGNGREAPRAFSEGPC